MSAETDHLSTRSRGPSGSVRPPARFADLGHADLLVVGERPDRLLVVDDALGDLGHGLVFARTIDDALRQVSRREFAVILLDAELPGGDVFDTVAAIRRYERAAGTPVVVLGSESGGMPLPRADMRGAIDVVAAPISPAWLREKVGTFVELHLLRVRVAGQREERASLADAVAALGQAEESIRRSEMLAELGLELSGVIDVRQAMHALLARIVPALAGTATVAMLGDDGVVEHAVTRSTLLDDVSASEDIAAARLPTAHYELLHAALALMPAERPRRAPHTDGALRMLPLVDGDRMLGALWVDGELTAAGAALLDDIARRAASAFATAALHRDLQREIEERRQAEARLDESHRRKDEFLAMLAHELRNPLAPIRNAVEVIRLVAPPEPTLRWAADVTDRQLRQLTRLVDELVDVARINEGKIVLQMQCVDLVALAAQCIEAHRPELEARGQTMSLATPGSAVPLNGDATRLTQVVDNLLKNASTYTPEGGAIAVSIVRESAEDGEFVALTVADDGIGIEPELLPRVFDLFEQGKRGLDRTQGGLGVGLTLVQRLVGLHGGSVWAESNGTGQGSHFRVRLPCMAEVDDVLLVDDRAAAATTLVARRILVVEDNLDVAETTTMLLTLSGHEVLCAKDGLQALQFAADFQPEVVLLDIGLPLMDGYEVARRLRQMPQTQRALVVALTGYGQEGDRQRGKDAGFDGHLLKPVDARALEAMIAS